MLNCGQQPGSAREWESVLSIIQCESSLLRTACSLVPQPPNIVSLMHACLSALTRIRSSQSGPSCALLETIGSMQILVWCLKGNMWGKKSHHASMWGFWSVQHDFVIVFGHKLKLLASFLTQTPCSSHANTHTTPPHLTSNFTHTVMQDIAKSSQTASQNISTEKG